MNVQTALEDDRCSQASPARGYDDQRLQLKRGARFVFQGDSITEMKWGRNLEDRINISDILTSTSSLLGWELICLTESLSFSIVASVVTELVI